MSDLRVGADTLVKIMANDHELLRDYVRQNSEKAFAGLVQRHLNLVYSAALRQVRSAQLAEEVAQSVFTDLARSAERLQPGTILSAWLFQVTRRTAIDVVRQESRRQARERLAVEMANMNTATDWTHIEPLLDEAMEALEDPDRAAVLLRYFENKSLREVGQALGTSDDAAQKRVTRAVDRLREFFAKRGVTVGASGLVVVLSANAVQAAPAGLAVTISATLGGTAVAASATATSTATKAIAMTTTQKACIAVALAAAVGTGIFQARQNSALREEIHTLRQPPAPEGDQVRLLQLERDDATNRLAALREENEQLKSGLNLAELLKLRGEVGVLRKQLAAAGSGTNAPTSGMAKLMSDPTMKEYIHQAQLKMIRERYGPLFKELKLTLEQTKSFTQLVGELWLKNSDVAASLPQGGSDRAKAVAAMADASRELDDDLRSLLGDDGYARYQEFGREIPAHTAVKLTDALLGDNRLSDDQGNRLVQIVNAEPFALTSGIVSEVDAAVFGSSADLDKHFEEVAQSHQRILRKAADFMTPEQLAALATVQSNSIAVQKAQGAALTQKR